MESHLELTQSPQWDDVLSLEEMCRESMFVILRKRHVHGDLAQVIIASYATNDHDAVYEYRSLSHDRYGITCEAEGTIRQGQVGQLIRKGEAELTCDFDSLRRHIWEVMQCHPNIEKLFTDLV